MRSLSLFARIVGEKFGTVTVIGRVGNDRNGGVSIRCDCGVEKAIRRGRLKTIQTCGAGTHRSLSGKLPGAYWANLKTNAKSRNLSFKITHEYAWELFQKQNGRCALTGRSIEIRKKSMTASLDRKDSSVGYEVGNMQWVHKDCNKMKMEFEQEYFIETCRQISAYHEDGIIGFEDTNWEYDEFERTAG
jgi:hypothetical protein